ncbi:MAG: TonB-dependent receptor plug domain-containing protein [Balneolaceae bacterium]|nr:TonB-dependent receptor plug domain-containing protein [Balneolaceae bacterium]
MKYLNAYIKITFFSLLLIVMGCATTGNGGVSGDSTYDSNTVKIIESSSDSIIDYLRRIAGVQVVGDGPSAQIKIREKSSFMSDTTPLFVINGIRAGKDFSSVYSMLNPSDIVSIEVLKGTDTSMYGMDGANGVIVISTKN